MLFKCFSCNNISFDIACYQCEDQNELKPVPLEPQFYPEFQYRSQGILKDIFVKRKIEKKLQDKLDNVLRKYAEFESPYFVNYMQLSGRSGETTPEGNQYSNLDLFQSVLMRLGFNELKEFPQLSVKLIRSTSFRFQYDDFKSRVNHHIKDKLEGALRSWIDERGSAFRQELPSFLFYLWENQALKDQIKFNDNEIPLVSNEELDRIRSKCENIYFDILVSRFKTTLEHFDRSKFITMYAVDAMDGYQFEDFLIKMFTTIGYDVEGTKKGADQGADLFVEKFGRKMVIQAKNYKDNVGNAAVQQVLAAKVFYGCDEAMVVTNNYFTNSAKELATNSDVKLVSRQELQEYLDDYNRTIMDQATRS